jgi:hypothetical protein
MGADAFITFYGIEETIPVDADVTALEERKDERIVRARKAKLDSWWGRLSDGHDYHLLIGKKIANIGVEGSEGASISDADFTTLRDDVKKKLKDAGYASEPKLILKLEAHC